MMHESSILMMNLGEVLKLRKLDWRNGNKFCIKETGYEKNDKTKRVFSIKCCALNYNPDCLVTV